MPILAVCVYCHKMIDEKDKSVNEPHTPGHIAHLICAQKHNIPTVPRK